MGYSGDGGAATSAKLFQPSQLAIDTIGNIFVTDGYNYRVRKIDLTGTIITIAGNGFSGYDGDGGFATAARIGGVSDIAFDKSGNLFIADGLNHRIRKVNMSTGIISSIAGNGVGGFAGDGGQATSASLNYPGHITFDLDGNMFISDVENRRVRKVDINGIITTVAGNGTFGYSGDGGIAINAEINSPHGLVTDAFGNLYISDAGNGRVRKLNKMTGIITTIAGNGTFTYSGDEIPATSAEVTPQGLAFDKYGNLYIADAEGITVGNRIRMVDTYGNIHTVAGNGLYGYSGDGGSAMLAKLASPWDILFDTCGNFYIADANNQRIRKVTFPYCNYLETADEPALPSHTFSIYPNPATATVTINAGEAIANISICNAVGQQVLELHSTGGKKSVNTNVQHLPAGIYVVMVNGLYAGKMVKGD